MVATWKEFAELFMDTFPKDMKELEKKSILNPELYHHSFQETMSGWVHKANKEFHDDMTSIFLFNEKPYLYTHFEFFLTLMDARAPDVFTVSFRKYMYGIITNMELLISKFCIGGEKCRGSVRHRFLNRFGNAE
jgi:hypothetical protein